MHTKKSTITIQPNEKNNMLTYTGEVQNVERRWLGKFVCDCGNIKLIRIDLVKKGIICSCGCVAPNKNKKTLQQKYGKDYPFYVLWQRTQKTAKERKIDFAITYNDIKSVYLSQRGLCIYSGCSIGLPSNFVEFDKNKTIASIDRIDPSIGYIKTNIQLTSRIINMMKHTLSNNEFIELCKLVSINDNIKNVNSDIVNKNIDYSCNIILKMVLYRSKKKNIECDLSEADIKSIYFKQFGRCFYTNQLLILPTNFLDKPNANISVDRIDSSKGYCVDNIQLVTKDINFLKQSMTHQEFINICKIISSKTKLDNQFQAKPSTIL